ncbi:aldo/keto reductase [Sciscionella sediminilitoris]|uniref:aldo/keto reductase n=1 Tax=Sciscionella sediminilitoris TaxID=1445613 RepID=UPI0004DF971B|nr:aldo/keto reductase [Sciscionella sp. SE31]
MSGRHRVERELGRSGVSVTQLGFGTAPIAGLYAEVEPELAAATLEAAWKAGIRHFDTAPHYGLGLAERRLGAFLGEQQTGAVVSTKVGRLLRPGRARQGDAEFWGTPDLVRVRDYRTEGVYASVAESLERTGLERFDILLIHDPDEHWEQAIDEAYPALERLRAEGAVRAIGVGMMQAEMPARFVRETDIDCVMLAGRYSLLDRTGADELLPLCAQRQVGVLVAGVFNGGILADPAEGARFDYRPADPATLERARELAAVCARHGVPLAAAAIQFPLRHPAVTSVVVGVRTPEELRLDVELLNVDIPQVVWAELA